MSITTLDGLLSGFGPNLGSAGQFIKVQAATPVVGNWYSLWSAAGIPSIGYLMGAGSAYKGRFFSYPSADTGALFFPGQVTGETIYLARFAGNANTTGTIILADRIWADSCSPIQTANVNVFTGSFPRSAGIGGGDSSGVGVMLGMEVYTALGASSVTTKCTIINSAGSADTVQCWQAVPTAVGSFVPMYSVIPRNAVAAASTAYGVRSVSVFHNSTSHTSGTWGITAFRPISRLSMVAAGIDDAIDALTSGFPILFPTSCPMIFWIAGTTTPTIIQGNVIYATG
jgi:hypothetical protein